ncbi:unnamed protein product [Orchesella dallaii]|uniref:Sulfotransferase domain-containing protein n=1 Tax=Orchesella dallaii TaxID=48710 RepID=A0ABP1PN17_9HEXA
MTEILSYSMYRTLKMRFIKEVYGHCRPILLRTAMFRGLKTGLSLPVMDAYQVTKRELSTCGVLRLTKSQIIFSSDNKQSGSQGQSSSKDKEGLPKSSGYGSQGENPPEKFDGGDYDEEKNEEYENQAEKATTLIRRLKKVLSTGVFVSVLAFVGYKRKAKRDEIADNIKDATFFKEENLFKGAVGALCLYEKPEMNGAKVVVPVSILKDGTIKRIQSLKVTKDDVIVASFPKAGTTWVQEIVYLLQTGLDFEKAGEKVLETRSPFLEYPYPGLDFVEKMSSPRVMKTHLPYDFLPSNCGDGKIIYVTRNPKDVVVSYYHFAKMFTPLSFAGSFEDFLEKFEKNELPYGPFFDHIESYVRHREDSNLLIVTYEELSKDPRDVIKKIAAFLEKPLDEEDVQKVVMHTSFESMKKNSAVNYEHWDDLGFRNKNESKFMRKGKIGDWRNFIAPDKNKALDEWISEQNKIKFPFVYET